MNPYDLRVYTSPYPKKRMGRDNDGGYVIVKIPNVEYSVLLAGGIQDDISFEEHFLKENPLSKCFAFDGTIPELPKTTAPIQFINKNIGDINTKTLTNLHDLIDQHENIFIKMDIEGGEIPWLKSLNETQMNKFEQIVMEFHTPFSNLEMNIFSTLNKTHTLVHFHGNNCCGTRKHNGVYLPNIFECTYIHKKYFTDTLNIEFFPTQHDMKNLLSKSEININYPPFVNISNPEININYPLFVNISIPKSLRWNFRTKKVE